MNRKLNTFFILFFTVPILFGVLVGISMLYGTLNQVSSHQAANTDATDESIILGTTEDLGQEYIDKIIFLGESTTYGLQSYGVLSGGTETLQVWTGATLRNGKAVSSGTLSLSPSIDNTKIFFPDNGRALTIAEAIKIKNPEILIITLGLNNGASYYTEESFKNCYRLLLDSVTAATKDTEIILQSLFPVSNSCQIKAYTPQRLALCNGWIYDIAKEYGLRYLNTTETLSDGDGYLKAEYDNGGDGIHLNKEGLCAVIEYIRTHGAVEKQECQNVFSEKTRDFENVFLEELNNEFGYCDVSEYYAKSYFSTLDGLIGCKIFTCNESTNFDEFGILVFKDEKLAQRAKKAVKQYLSNAKEEFKSGIVYNIAEYPKFESARAEVFGEYLVYAILEKTSIDNIFEKIDNIT